LFLLLAIYFFRKVSRVTEGKKEEVTKGQSNLEERNKIKENSEITFWNLVTQLQPFYQISKSLLQKLAIESWLAH
jgi:hypothetical protein